MPTQGVCATGYSSVMCAYLTVPLVHTDTDIPMKAPRFLPEAAVVVFSTAHDMVTVP